MVVEQPGGVDALKPVQLSRLPIGANEVRIRVLAAGANPVDASNRADPSWAGLTPPYVVGYECAGIVIETGDLVADLHVDQPVWAHLPVRGTRGGAYAEELVADAAFVAPRPASLTPLEAAALPLAGSTALQLLDRLDPAAGEWLLVHGAAGGVGHLLVQVARMRGVRIAALASPARHDFLRSLGVEVVIDRFHADALELAREAVGEDFSLAADLVGKQRLAVSLPFIAEGGRAASIVELAGDYEDAIDRNLTLHGVLVHPQRVSLQRLTQLVANGLKPVIDDVVPLEDCRRAHRRLESGSGRGKLVLAVAG